MNTTKEDQILINRIKELANISYQKGICTYTDFLNLNELNIFYRVMHSLPGIQFKLFGGYQEAERQILCFYDENCGQEPIFPIRCIKISPTEPKFSQILTHRDFLGSILNLGIKRNRIGDILTLDNGAYVFCNSRIADFVMDNLYRIKHTGVRSYEEDLASESVTPNYIEIKGTVSSIRLDAVLALAFNASRSSLLGLIEGGKVFVNSKLVESNSHILKENDIVSVRGYGKFVYKNKIKQTKKGRLSILLLKYN